MSMQKINRIPAPGFLEKNWEAWGLEWEQRQAQGKKFSWKQHEGITVNLHLLPILSEQTNFHCSFCDISHFSPPSSETIEHFRPKGKFPKLAYQWENLFYCCDFCQNKKREFFDEKLLKPDAPDYEFDRYFRWDYTTGELHPKHPDCQSPDMERAQITIETYGLNATGHLYSRRRELSRRAKDPTAPLDGFSYRTFLSNPQSP